MPTSTPRVGSNSSSTRLLGEQPLGDRDLLLVAAAENAPTRRPERALARPGPGRTPRDRRRSRRLASISPKRVKRSITGSETLCRAVELAGTGASVLRSSGTRLMPILARTASRGDVSVTGLPSTAIWPSRERASCRSRRGRDRAGPCPAARRRRGSRPACSAKRGVVELAAGARACAPPAPRRRIGCGCVAGRGGKVAASERPMIMRITSSSLIVVDRGGADVLAVAQHRERVAEGAHLRQAMRDEDDRDARRLAAARSGRRASRCRGPTASRSARRAAGCAACGRRRGRSRSSGAPADRGRGPRRAGRSQSRPRSARCAATVARAVAPAQQAERVDRRVGQQHVVGDRQIADLGHFLEGGLRCRARWASRGLSQADRLAERARSSPESGCIKPAQQLDHGRLAGAVLAEQGVDARRPRPRTTRRRAPRSRRRPCAIAGGRAMARASACRSCSAKPRTAGGQTADAGSRAMRSSVLGLADQRGLQADLGRLRRVDRARTSPGLATSDGWKALQPAFISSQVPSLQSLIVSLVTIGSGSVVSFGMSLPSSFSTASFSASAPE